MGNKKNEKSLYSNKHRHAYGRKKLPWQARKSRQQNRSIQEQTVSLEGSRIINMDQLQQYTEDMTKHATQCQGSITLSGEVRDGLASIVSGDCSTCSHTIMLQTSKKVKGSP